jgi:hypothetical protein
MAKARRTTTRSGTDLVVVQAAAPPARRSSGGIRRRRSSGRKRRRSVGGGGGGGTIQNRVIKTAMGGALYGMLVKNFPTLPRIPGLGRSGTVAAAIYFLRPSSPWLQDMGIAAAAIAGASFGETGNVSGDGDDVLTSD